MSESAIKRALISVTNKDGVAAFAKALQDEFGVEIISTGGTAKVLAEAGVDVRPIEDYTGFPEMMDGRVKTLHPKVHGGLLARRNNPSHMADAKNNGISMIDLVVVNLYEFEKTIAKPGVTYQEAIENIDIGGPSMLRSAAKNHESVTVVVNPADYEVVLNELRANNGATTLATRKRLAVEVFKITSAYDNAIYTYLAEQQAKEQAAQADAQAGENDVAFPDEMRLFLTKQQDLRYGENPHQKAAFYRTSDCNEYSLAAAEQLQGKELSYNNFLDTDACWAAVREFEQPACIIVKHMNPCGAADGKTIEEAYQRAYECDPVSAYGGIIACNRPVTGKLVQQILDNKQFIEVVIAPDFEPEALELLAQKPKARVLKTGGMNASSDFLEYRKVEGGMLVQECDEVSEQPATFTVPTKTKPTPAQMDDLLFAWKVVKAVKSNAILLVKDHANVGMGAGQPNRVNSARIAIEQAQDKAKGAACASDAFFPFRDNIDVLAAAGVTAVIQPGGSIRDQECIDACDEHGIAMVFTGHRHFRH